jgi:tetratricopeptide (TPR) repeat protein
MLSLVIGEPEPAKNDTAPVPDQQAVAPPAPQYSDDGDCGPAEMSETEGVSGAGVRRRPRWRRRIALAVGLVAALALLVITGILVYQQARQKRVRQRLKKVKTMMSLDTAVAYREASRALAKLAAEQPDSAEIAVVRAEVEAIQWGRFGSGKRARASAEEWLDKAAKLDAAGEERQVVQGYLLLYAGDYEGAARLAERALVHNARSPRLGHILGLSRFRLGDLEAAEATLRMAMSHDKDFLPAKYHLAAVQRLRGRTAEARQLLVQILAQSARHLGARIELALLRLENDGRADAVLADKLVAKAKEIPVYKARAALYRGKVAVAQGRMEKARKAFQQAAMTRPNNPEYFLALVEHYLRPGGEVLRAQAAAGEALRRAREYPRAPLILARLALAVGNPQKALDHLKDARMTFLTPRDQCGVEALRIQALYESFREARAMAVCNRLLRRKKRAAGPKAGRAVGAAAESAPDAAAAVVREPRIMSRLVFEACTLLGVQMRSRPLLRRLKKAARGKKQLYRLASGGAHLIAHRPVRARRRLADFDPSTSVAVGLLKARALQALFRPRGALDGLRAADRRAAGSARTRLWLAEGCLRAGDTQCARTAYARVEALRPQGPRLLLDLGRVGLRLREKDKVVERAERLQKDAATKHLGEYLQGLSLSADQRWKASTAAFRRALEKYPGWASATAALGRVAFARGRTAQGRILFNRAYRQADKDPSMLQALARLYAEHGTLRQTTKAYLSAIRAFRRRGSRYKASELYSELGELLSHQEKKNRRQVESYLKRAVSYDPAHPLAYYRWAEYLRRRGKAPLSVRWYRKAARAGPEMADAHYGLAWVLLHLKRSPATALAALQRFAELETGTARARRVRRMRKRLKRLQKRR